MPFEVALAALILEACIGYPRWLHARIPHPVTGIGGLISAQDYAWNQPRWSDPVRKGLGVLTVLLAAGVAGLTGWAIGAAPGPPWLVGGLVVAAASTGLAQRSLHQHVAAVDTALQGGDIDAARVAVGAIVGRDTDLLGADEVAAAAIESLAESFNDGVVAPAFWLVVGGLPGLFVYKAVNTADSLIGHKEARWRAFGWAAASSDDVMNLIPARLAGALICLAGGGGWLTMRRDAAKHASPNAGWPEAAMAGALGVQLGGPAWYDRVRLDRPVFGDGAAVEVGDLKDALAVYRRACLLLWGLVFVGAVAWAL